MLFPDDGILGHWCVMPAFWRKGCKIKRSLWYFGFIVFPVAVYLIYIMTPNGWVYTLMAYSVVFIHLYAALGRQIPCGI